VLNICRTRNVLQNNDVSSEINALPLSDKKEKPRGMPNLLTTLSNSARTTVSASVLSTAINSGHMLVLSMMTNICLLPSADVGKLVWWFMCHRVPGSGTASDVVGVLLGCAGRLAYWHTGHDSTWSLKNAYIPGK
jgi:hypothetical protein